ncbi:MAG: hypothetical protein HC800_24965 [Phormidesmis sp. RL_2_1]|nr:hypothetical protein [Phormidesmis sp. RL_2_1]
MPFSLSSFRRTLSYRNSTTAVQLKAHLKQIRDQDAIAEQKKKIYIPVAIFCGLLAFGGLFLLELFAPIIFLVGLLGVVAIGAGVMAARWNHWDVSNLRYELPLRLADLLSRDMSKESLLNVSLDFSSPTDKSKDVGTEPWLVRAGWKQTFFEDPWMQLSGTFLDSTTFTLTFTDFNVTRAGWKRGRSGKRKYKRKTKFKGAEIQLMLKFSRKRYGAMGLLASDLPQAVHLPDGVLLKKSKANDHQLVLQVKVPANSALFSRISSVEGFYQLFIKMLLSAYQALNLSKELSKAAS